MDNLPEVLAAPLRAGEKRLIFHGNLNDFEMVDGELVYRPAYYLNSLFRAGYVILSFSKSQLPKIYRFDDFSAEKKKLIEKHLKQFNLYPLPKDADLDDPQGLRVFLTNVHRLLLSDEPELPIALHIDFGEHVYGGAYQAGAESPEVLIMREFLASLISPAFRKAGKNMVLIYHYNDPIPEKLQTFHQVQLPFPDKEQTEAFIEYASSKENYAALSKNLPKMLLSKILRGLPMIIIEKIFRHCASRNEVVELELVANEKARSIVTVSENTLSLEQPGELKSFDEVKGMRVVKQYLQVLAERLRSGLTAGRGLLLIGPPGTAKSTLVALTAKLAGFNCLKFAQIKDSLVGRSEFLVKKALDLILASSPSIVFLDEIDKFFSNNGGMDGGVQAFQLGALLQFLADDKLRHKQIFVMGTSNHPMATSAPLRDRFVCLPVIGAVPDEIPDLLVSMVPRLKGELTDNNKAEIKKAAATLYDRGASPRQMLDVIQHHMNLKGDKLTCADLAAAADDFSGQTDPGGVSVQAAVMQSIAMCSFRSLYPFAGDKNYPLPEYLKDCVDLEANRVNQEILNKKLLELNPYANL